MYVPSEVMLVAPYIFLYTSGTVVLTIGEVVLVVGVVVLVVELLEQEAAKKLNIKRYIILILIGEGLTNWM
jgi:hypothetical protein